MVVALQAPSGRHLQSRLARESASLHPKLGYDSLWGRPLRDVEFGDGAVGSVEEAFRGERETAPAVMVFSWAPKTLFGFPPHSPVPNSKSLESNKDFYGLYRLLKISNPNLARQEAIGGGAMHVGFFFWRCSRTTLEHGSGGSKSGTSWE